MRGSVVIFCVFLLSPACRSRPAEESESVVSVYTTQTTTAGTGPPLDVYHQIANNIADRITSPIYRFLGINTTKSETSTKRPWDNIELLDDDVSKTDVKPLDNTITPPRDIEEISNDGTKNQSDRKPEKIILYSSYLPTNSKLELNETNEIDDEDSFNLNDVDVDDDDVNEGKGAREGPLIYLMELFGSILQLLWGGFLALFRPSSSEGS